MSVNIEIFAPGYDKKEFYGLMGDILTYQTLKKELPYLYNSATMTWFLAFDDSKLVGFAAVDVTHKKIVLDNHYVFPEYRNNGIYEKLLNLIFEYASKYNLPLTAIISNKNLVDIYIKMGFEITRETKNFTFMLKK